MNHCQNCMIDALMFIGGLIIVIVVFNMSFEDEMADQQEYCEMVELYKKTNGQFGWPRHRDFSCPN